MSKAIIFCAIFATAGFQASAETDDFIDLSLLPPEVAERVVELEMYGDRFEPAIRAIFAEHAKPSSSFDNCPSESHEVLVAPAQS